MPRRPPRTLRLEKPRGRADRSPVPRGEPEIVGTATLNIGGKQIPIPILSSQSEIMRDIEKAKKFLRKKVKDIFGCLLLATLLASPALADSYRPGYLIVKPYQEPATQDDGLHLGSKRYILRPTRDRHSLGTNEAAPLGKGRYLLRLSDGTSIEAAMTAIEPEVEYAGPDYIVYADLVPNEGLYTQQYHHQIMNSETAWDVTTGDPNVVIGIVDTGVDFNSPDLASGFLGGYDFWNDAASQYPGTGWDTQYHGTHCAGICCGIGNNGVNIAGLAWGCSWKSYKFLNGRGSGFTSDAILGIDQAVADDVDILTNSWGGGGFSQPLLDSVNAACDAGILFVAAAGNDGQNTDANPHYPSSYAAPCILSVGSSDANDALSSFSNFGPVTVDLLAPGGSITSLPGPAEGSQTQKPNNFAAAIRSGTSMATPQVAGAAALALSVHPDWTWVELIPAILGSVDVIPAATETVSGGRLNVGNLLSEITASICGDALCSWPAEDCAVCSTDCGQCPSCPGGFGSAKGPERTLP